MRPEEFIHFEAQKPELNKWIIVTNNINVKNSFGEMSHVWLTNFWIESIDNKEHGVVTFDNATRKIINPTHWKYA